MIEIEKVRKRTRKNWKRETKRKYKYLMYLAKQQINNATKNYCYIKRHYSREEYFALWLVAKKLEAKGFKCELSKGTDPVSSIFCWDTLDIEWE